jgi:hypothetical protein
MALEIIWVFIILIYSENIADFFIILKENGTMLISVKIRELKEL